MLESLNPRIPGFGLDLSDLSMKIARVKKQDAGFVLTNFGRQEIKEGLIENGEIKKEKELVETIREGVARVKGGKLDNAYCVASLPETLSFVEVIKMPLMNEKELSEAIKWEIEAHIPLSKDEAYYDWHIINKGGKEKRDHLDVILGVLPRKTVDPYLAVLKKAGLRPMVFEIEPIATARALIKNGRSEDPVIIIDIGAKRTSLLIFYGQAIYFTSGLPINNSLIVETFSEKLKTDRAKALQIKLEVGMNPKHPASIIYKESALLLLNITQKIQNYIDFYNDHIMNIHADRKNIKKIILCGGGAMMDGLPEFFQKELNLPVEMGDPWINICSDPNEKPQEFPQKDSLSFATAFGLAIRPAA